MADASKDSPLELKISGPRWRQNRAIWTATARVLGYQLNGSDTSFEHARSTRPVYIPLQPTQLNHFPVTLLARCHITNVCLRFGDDQKCKSGNAEATLLLGVDPADWQPRRKFARLQKAICLAGEFDLQTFVPEGSPSHQMLMEMLKGLVGDGSRIKNLRALSSGLGFSGDAILRGTSVKIVEAPYLIEVEVPPPTPDQAGKLPDNEAGKIIVRLDRELLEQKQFTKGKKSLESHFAELVSRLNPVESVTRRPMLSWSRFELADPTRLPDFQWRITPTPHTMEFEFGSGMWRLSLADQPVGVEGVVARSSIITEPKVKIETLGQQILVKASPKTVTDGLWDGFAAQKPQAEYRADPAGANQWSESISVRRIDLGYDAVDAARRVRAQYGLPTPRPDDFDQATSGDLLTGGAQLAHFSDGKIDPPMLWGFTPLEDGWSQLPFLNLTEQLLVDGLPDAKSPTPLERRGSQLHGAAVFGNDGVPVVRGPGEAPWNVVLSGARDFLAVWTLSSTGLQSAILTLDDPTISAEGLFWLATESPDAKDALPSHDNWLASLAQIPLRTLRVQPRKGSDGKFVEDPNRAGMPLLESTDPYPSPFLLTNVELKFERKMVSAENANRALADLRNFSYAYQWSHVIHRGTDHNSQIVPNSTNTALPITALATVPAWLTLMPRSRFLQERIWMLPAGGDATEAGTPGLAWRRHPHHPCIQVLPLTQSSTPPNHLSPSRQLAPFELPLASALIKLEIENGPDVPPLNIVQPQNWQFTCESKNKVSAAAAWPITGDLKPAKIWSELQRLPMAALGLPGFALLSQPGGIKDDSKFLAGVQYRIDLPYLDEPYALADLPGDLSPGNAPLSQSPLPPPPALLRGDYGRHWNRLDDRALLAAADAVDSLHREGKKTFAVTLVEPLRWEVNVDAKLNSYPGVLVFKDISGQELRLAGGAAETDALRGFDGGFDTAGNALKLLEANPDPAGWNPVPIRMVGGSFTATVQTSGMTSLRDQRGLLRGGTTEIIENNPATPLRTPLQLDLRDPLSGTLSSQKVSLFSLRQVAALKAGSDANWKFWFKALPMTEAAGGHFEFAREKCQSRPTGINDPGAMDREHGHLTGYEWILSDSADAAFLDLGSFHFYPLELEFVKLDNVGQVVDLKILGRLQLVLFDVGPDPRTAWRSRELTNLDTAVYFTFKNGSLSAIEAAIPDGDGKPPGQLAQPRRWPLVDPDQCPESPVLVWNKIALSVTGGKTFAVLSDWRLEYARHGLAWSLLPAVEVGSGQRKSLSIQIAAAPESIPFEDFDLATVNPAGLESDSPADAIRINKVVLTLDFPKHRHDVEVKWQLNCGSAGSLQLRVTLNDHFFTPTAKDDRTLSLFHKGTEVPLVGEWHLMPAEIIDRRALQVAWARTELDEKDLATLQLLPGFGLVRDENALSGFVVFSFELESPAGNGAIQPTLRGAYLDGLFQCVWGAQLQSQFTNFNEDIEAKQRDGLHEAVFNSSAGQVTGEYTIRYSAGNEAEWDTNLMLSGLLEVKNLISWPLALKISDRFEITLPSAKNALKTDGLNHWRHTIRIALSEHNLNGKMLQGGVSAKCFLTLKDGEAWTIPAVVEHQLLALTVQCRDGGKGPNGTDLWVTSANGERRWTCTQQVRICSPRAVFNHLTQLAHHNSVDSILDQDDWPIEHLEDAIQGWHAESFRRAFSVDIPQNPTQTENFFKASAFGKELGEALVVEASVPLFIRRSPLDTKLGTDLLSLQRGTVRAGLANLTDYWSDPSPDKNSEAELQWLFASIPFLGRTQVEEGSDGVPLKADPILGISDAIRARKPIPPRCQALSNWSGAAPTRIFTTQFDISTLRWFRRLDPASQREAWFRLNMIRATNAGQVSDGTGTGLKVPNLLEVGASDSVALLARAKSLGLLFDARRMSLPPIQLPIPVPTLESEIVWSRNSLHAMVSALQPRETATHPYAFLGLPLVLHQSAILDGEEPTRRHPAATFLPALADGIQVPYLKPDGTPAKSTVRSTLQPVTLALSPFVSLAEFRFAEELSTVGLMAVGELIAFDIEGRTVSVVDSQLSHAQRGQTDFAAGFRIWGATCHAQQAADSSVAVVRMRMLEAVFSPENPEVVLGIRQRFEFLPIEVVADERKLLSRAFSLRTFPEQIRQSEGQFRGTWIPQSILTQTIPAYALAPPLVRGVQPIRLNQRRVLPKHMNDWPWGFAGLRLSIVYRHKSSGTESDVGVAGPRFVDKSEVPLWWQSFAQPVQFANPTNRESLPRLFRAPALPGYLATWPHTPLPPAYALQKIADQTQPILPGSRRVIITGSRPGVPFAFREFLTTQTVVTNDLWSVNPNDNVQSASVPVQHRPPRPVLIPKSTKGGQAVALRTWGSWFDLDEALPETSAYRTLSVSQDPQDEAFLLRPGQPQIPAGAVRISLARPTEKLLTAAGVPEAEHNGVLAEMSRISPILLGEVASNWDGALLAVVKHPSTQLKWKVAGAIRIANESVPLIHEVAPPTAAAYPLLAKYWANLKNDLLYFPSPAGNVLGTQFENFQKTVRNAASGTPVQIAITAELDEAIVPDFEVKGYSQTLSFQLRISPVDSLAPRSGIFAPRFIQFEDPEYNRLLSSVPSKTSRNTPLDAMTSATITLAADRTEYNPGDIVHVVYDRGPTRGGLPANGNKGKLDVIRITEVGAEDRLGTIDLEENKLADPEKMNLARLSSGRIKPNENLILRLRFEFLLPSGKSPDPIDLVVAIVAQPVTPVPQAAYAMLRAAKLVQGPAVEHVECFRFAWAPDPVRIELVCPDDLKSDIIRRRAVFQTQDSVRNRADRAYSYSIQKITALGSTHFPNPQ